MSTRISRVLWLMAVLTVSVIVCSPIFAQGRYPTNIATLQWGNVTGLVVGATGMSGDGSEKLALVGGTEGQLYSTNNGGVDVFVAIYSNGVVVYSNQLGTASNDLATAVASSFSVDSLSVVGGQTEGSLFGANAGGNDIFFGVFSNATLITSNQIGTASNDVAYAVDKRYGDNASIIVAGATDGSLYGASIGKADAIIGVYSNRYEHGLTAMYTNQFGTTEDDVIYGARFKSEVITGGVYGAVGYTEGSFGTDSSLTNKGGRDIMFALFSEGAMIATNIIGSSADDEGKALVFDNDNNTYVVGYTKGAFGSWNGIVPKNAGAEDAFLAKLDSVGAVVWVRVWGSPTSDIATAVALDSATNVYVVGTTKGSFDGQVGATGTNRIFMTMFDKDGSKQWTRIFGTNVMAIASSRVSIDVSGNTNLYVLSDTATTNNATSNDLYLATWQLASSTNVTEAPILYSPLGTGAVSGTASPLFNWSVVPGANYYTLTIQGSFAGVYTYIGSNSFSVPFSSTEGTFSWYVKGYVSDSGEATPYSSTGTFTFADGTFANTPSKPTAVSPSGLILTNNPTLVWNNGNNDATSYYVKIASGTTDVYVSREDIVWEAGVTNFSLYCSNANLATAEYTWQVIGSNNVGVGSNWSDALSFIVFPYPSMAPIVVSPTNGTVTNTYRPTFVWSNVQYAEYYQVRYWPVGSAIVATQTLLSLTSMSLDVSGTIGYTNRVVEPLAAGTSYYWSIRAGNSNAVGPWSTNNVDWSFTIPYPTMDPVSPVLIYPTGTLTDTRSPVFSWAESWGAVGYLLSVNYATNPGIYIVSTNVTSLNWSNSSLRLANDMYYWRVSAVGTNGIYSLPASETNFVIAVTNDGSFVLSTNAVSVIKGYGDTNSSSVSFDIINSGGLELVYSNSVSYGDGASGWWNVDGQTGTVTFGGFATVTSSIVSTGLPSGVYYATNAVAALLATNSPQYVAATLTVTQQVLTVTADDKSKVYGQTNPTFTVTYTGFVVGESTNVLTSLAVASCTAGTTTAVGSYPIAASNASAVNYVFNYVDGTLTITAGADVSLTITVTPMMGGTTFPSAGVSTNIPAGTWYAINASPAIGYSFTNWSITSGTAEIANQYSTNTEVKLDTSTTILATFRLVGVRSLPWLILMVEGE